MIHFAGIIVLSIGAGLVAHVAQDAWRQRHRIMGILAAPAAKREAHRG